MEERYGRIPPEKVDEVRLAADIAEVVGRRVRLIAAGRSLKGLCPFHADSDPSLVVNRQRGTWHCFGCGAGGNAFNFLMQDEGLSFPEAVRELARRFGVSLPPPKLTPAQRRSQQVRDRLLRVLALAGTFFADQLAGPGGEAAQEYLLGRRGLDPGTVKSFGLGWAPAGWENLGRFLAAQGVPQDLAIKAGVLAPGRKGPGAYDRFRERVVFPIHDLGGRVVSFGGRVLAQGEPKYLNGPESLVFHKSRTLYNLHQARAHMRRKDRALVVEGYFDVITLAAHGFGETVAPLGTALTAEQVRLLAGQAREALVIFDGDQAGLKAAERSLPVFLDQRLPVRACLLPPGQDPDDFLRQHGPAALEEALAQARPLTEVVLDRVVAQSDLSTPEGKSACAAAAGQVLSQIGDPVTAWEYLGRTAQALGLPRQVLASRLGLKLPHEPSAPSPARTGRAGASQTSQLALLELALASGQAARVLCEGGALECIEEPGLKVAAQAIEQVLAQGGEPEAARVIDALSDPAHQGLVSRLASRAQDLTPQQAAEQAQALLDKLGPRLVKRRTSKLTKEIAQAEAAGDAQQVARLQDQRRQLSSPNHPLTAEKD